LTQYQGPIFSENFWDKKETRELDTLSMMGNAFGRSLSARRYTLQIELSGKCFEQIREY
jgi:hypothetical protein